MRTVLIVLLAALLCGSCRMLLNPGYDTPTTDAVGEK